MNEITGINKITSINKMTSIDEQDVCKWCRVEDIPLWCEGRACCLSKRKLNRPLLVDIDTIDNQLRQSAALGHRETMHLK
jgi:hypothetical protein